MDPIVKIYASQDYVDDAISTVPGEKVEGTQYTITEDDGSTTTVTAYQGAEVFNDYVNNKAIGNKSHAEGMGTIAQSNYQHAQGQYNLVDKEETYAHIVGNGTSTERSNAHTVSWNGEAWFSGDVYVDSTSGTNKDEGSKKLATEEFVNSAISNADIDGFVSIDGGTMQGPLVADSISTLDLTFSQVRNITAGTEDLIAGESRLPTGELYIVYEVE